MKENHQKWAKKFAEQIVNDFVDNPQFRGEKFTFEQLPEMIFRLSKVSAFMSFPSVTPHEEEQICELAKMVSEQILKEKKLI